MLFGLFDQNSGDASVANSQTAMTMVEVLTFTSVLCWGQFHNKDMFLKRRMHSRNTDMQSSLTRTILLMFEGKAYQCPGTHTVR